MAAVDSGRARVPRAVRVIGLERGLIFVPLYYAGTLLNQTAGRRESSPDEIHLDAKDRL